MPPKIPLITRSYRNGYANHFLVHVCLQEGPRNKFHLGDGTSPSLSSLSWVEEVELT